MPTARSVLDSHMSEADLQTALEEALDLFGWSWFHRSDRQDDLAVALGRYDVLAQGRGFYDLVACKRELLILAECKAKRGRLTALQKTWGSYAYQLAMLTRTLGPAGFVYPLQYHILRPQDLSSGFVDLVVTQDPLSFDKDELYTLRLERHAHELGVL